MLKFYFALMLLIFTQGVAAKTTEPYQFESREQSLQFEQLTNELRCVVCQNQTIASSDAPLAMDLKALIHQKIVAGEDTSTVKAYIVERYGDFVLYQPPLNKKTFLLWFGPVGLLILALLMVGRAVTFKEA